LQGRLIQAHPPASAALRRHQKAAGAIFPEVTMPAPHPTLRTAQNWPVVIGEAARRAGVCARMVRHYESLGLLAPVHRTDSGTRQYTEADVHTLRFIRRGDDLGFSMEEIGTLLGLWQNQDRASSQVETIAQKHITALTERTAAMQSI